MLPMNVTRRVCMLTRGGVFCGSSAARSSIVGAAACSAVQSHHLEPSTVGVTGNIIFSILAKQLCERSPAHPHEPHPTPQSVPFCPPNPRLTLQKHQTRRGIQAGTQNTKRVCTLSLSQRHTRWSLVCVLGRLPNAEASLAEVQILSCLLPDTICTHLVTLRCCVKTAPPEDKLEAH